MIVGRLVGGRGTETVSTDTDGVVVKSPARADELGLAGTEMLGIEVEGASSPNEYSHKKKDASSSNK